MMPGECLFFVHLCFTCKSYLYWKKTKKQCSIILFRTCGSYFCTNHAIFCFLVTDFSVQIIPSASPPPTPREKGLELPKTSYNTMKQTKNLKWKLSENQLDMGSMIDPKTVNEVECWALGSAYWTVHLNVNKGISNAASVGNYKISLYFIFSKNKTWHFYKFDINTWVFLHTFRHDLMTLTAKIHI